MIDIGHPAHVHYFRNFIKIMEKRGHSFFIIAKDRKLIEELLKNYNIPFTKRRKYPKCILGKLIYIPFTDFFIIRQALKFRPELLVGFSGTHISHVGYILRIPSIVFDDTDHAYLAHLSYIPFCSLVFTPTKFNKDFGRKHIRFEGSMDLAYLHYDYYKPNKDIFNLLKIKEDEKYIMMRFVSWTSNHDFKHKGVTKQNKIEAVKILSQKCKVFISSEEELPEELKQYELKIPSHRIHDALYYAELFWGESGTMATEACVLGTPAINISTSALLVGVFDDFVNNNLLYIIPDNIEAINKAVELLKDVNLKNKAQESALKMIVSKIDVNRLMIWIAENVKYDVNKLLKYKFIDKEILDNIYDKQNK